MYYQFVINDMLSISETTKPIFLKSRKRYTSTFICFPTSEHVCTSKFFWFIESCKISYLSKGYSLNSETFANTPKDMYFSLMLYSHSFKIVIPNFNT